LKVEALPSCRQQLSLLAPGGLFPKKKPACTLYHTHPNKFPLILFGCNFRTVARCVKKQRESWYFIRQFFGSYFYRIEMIQKKLKKETEKITKLVL